MDLSKFKRGLKALFGREVTLSDYNHVWTFASANNRYELEEGKILETTLHAERVKGSDSWFLFRQAYDYNNKSTYCLGSIQGTEQVNSTEDMVDFMKKRTSEDQFPKPGHSDGYLYEVMALNS